jgi:hypothetical protein
MTVDQENVTVDQDALLEFIGRFVADLGSTMAAGSVVVGHRLGLYSAMAVGPATPEQLAESGTGTNPRYVIEWLAGQAAGDYVATTPQLAPSRCLRHRLSH